MTATPDAIAGAVRERLADATALPMPGGGDTKARWQQLTAWAREHVVVGRLLEAHADATVILTELAATPPATGEWWGVWAAEPPQPVVLGERAHDTTWTLTGTKPWCSGAGWCTHALMTVRAQEAPDERHLVAVDLRQPGVRIEDTWHNAGMRASRTWSVHFDDVEATWLGPGSAYLDRPGFWHGGAGVAACWLGGASAVADRLLTTTRDDLLHRAAQGRVRVALTAARWAMQAAAAELDADPDHLVAARIRALQIRALVDTAATTVLTETGRALGAGPLCLDPDHAARVADLTVYLRQGHGDRDLASLAQLLEEAP
ncbi:acyl-CoA dehydrogenase family protein [Ammonicoccus fulvus]|uniref:Acyl-CoA dehydrogenase family protein n=1 Tax=Ammonicoccus fulvus TaxID=3138240 RepID=A0ABZ3FK87_9ACTN